MKRFASYGSTSPFAFALLVPLCLAPAGCDDDSTAQVHADGSTGGARDGAADVAAPVGGAAGDAGVAPDAPVSLPGTDGGVAIAKKKRAIIFVWDGLRPDSINATDTPNLAAMKAAGSWFSDNHSTYPTFTMMNAASFASGGFPADTSFYGNTLYEPGAKGSKLNAMGKATDGSGAALDFTQPVFTEDYQVLEDLRTYYGGALFKIGTLFEAAHAQGLQTATVGKTGAAFIQDYRRGGIILDERMAWPIEFARELQAANVALPATTPLAYSGGDAGVPDGGALTIGDANGSPTSAPGKVTLTAEGASSDPTTTTNPYTSANAYMMSVFTDFIFPRHTPDLALIWFRNPDSTEHAYGPGTPAYRDALKAQDDLLKALLDKLAAYGVADTTDVIVVSDHGHSSVSGPLALFPLRGLTADPANAAKHASFGGLDPAAGYSVSGDVRTADLITNAGIGVQAFDGTGCVNDPVFSGVRADGSRLYTGKVDTTGVCGGTAEKPVPYTWPAYRVPAAIPAGSVVIAANGGSEYIYATDTDPTAATATVKKVVAFLQSREEVGAIFVAAKHGAIAGTLALNQIRVEGTGTRNPDVVYSFSWDKDAVVQGLPGTEFESAQNNRGMHGSFSPVDVHNTLLAKGPDFKAAFADPLPSGNVDVAPTVAQILGLTLPAASGRPLREALAGGVDPATVTVTPNTLTSTSTAAITMTNPLNQVETAPMSYTVRLQTKQLTQDGKVYTYFDWAQAVRQ